MDELICAMPRPLAMGDPSWSALWVWESEGGHLRAGLNQTATAGPPDPLKRTASGSVGNRRPVCRSCGGDTADAVSCGHGPVPRT